MIPSSCPGDESAKAGESGPERTTFTPAAVVAILLAAFVANSLVDYLSARIRIQWVAPGLPGEGNNELPTATE